MNLHKSMFHAIMLMKTKSVSVWFCVGSGTWNYDAATSFMAEDSRMSYQNRYTAIICFSASGIKRESEEETWQSTNQQKITWRRS